MEPYFPVIDPEQHLDLVMSCAGAVSAHTAGRVTKLELLGPGWEGLHKAATRFKPSRGVSFGAYARIRVLGSMRDFLRSLRDNYLHEDDGTGCERTAPTDEHPEELSRELFGKLSPRVQSMAYMYYVDLLPYHEIAKKHCCHESLVCKLLKGFRESIGAPRAYRGLNR